MDLTSVIRTIPNYPKTGIMFRDITTLLGDGPAFSETITRLSEIGAKAGAAKVAGIEARGFILGGAIAQQLGIGFIPIRKKGKLPWDTISQEYELEYGVDEVEMHKDAVAPGEKILLVDDLIATGGTAEAGIKLIEKAGGVVESCLFVIDLPDLGGAAKLRGMGKSVHALVAFEGE